MNDQTAAAALLDQQPGLRELVAALPAFNAWRAQMPVVEIDGVTFHVLGGDQLKDDDELIVAWINQFRPSLLKGDCKHGSEPH